MQKQNRKNTAIQPNITYIKPVDKVFLSGREAIKQATLYWQYLKKTEALRDMGKEGKGLGNIAG